MVAIETEHGRFEAETEKEALKAARAAKRVAAAQQKQREADYKVAVLRAEANGYRILSRVATGNVPRGWIYYRPTDRYSAVQVTVKVDCMGEHAYHEATYETDGGRLTVAHHGYTVDGVVADGAGFVMAVFLRENRRAEENSLCPVAPEGYAIGVEGESWCLRELPGVRPETFAREGAAEVA